MSGQLLSPFEDSQWSILKSYVKHLCSHIYSLCFTPHFNPTDLRMCSHIFFRHYGVRKPLHFIHDGPFSKEARRPPFLKMANNHVVSMDCLKYANVDNIYDANKNIISLTLCPSERNSAISTETPLPHGRTSYTFCEVWPSYLS
ncbi:hypothetical protein ACTXT7_000747 [Hymenolepis weldensis]